MWKDLYQLNCHPGKVVFIKEPVNDRRSFRFQTFYYLTNYFQEFPPLKLFSLQSSSQAPLFLYIEDNCQRFLSPFTFHTPKKSGKCFKGNENNIVWKMTVAISDITWRNIRSNQSWAWERRNDGGIFLDFMDKFLSFFTEYALEDQSFTKT